MIKRKQNQHFVTRYWFVAVLMVIACLAIAARALHLHVFNKAFLQQEGDARTIRNVSIPSHRGMILDRHGEPLAISTPVDSIWINPKQINALEVAERDRVLNQLASHLELSLPRLLARVERYKQKEFLYLKRHVEPMVSEAVKELKASGVFAEKEYRRYYPEAEVASHIVGFTNIDDHGQEGMELAYEEWLSGTQGKRKVLKDRLGRVVQNIELIRAATPGEDLVLSIDRRLQYLTYSRLKQAVQTHRAVSGSAVMLDVKSGEILALVNQPSYNPNNRADRVSDRVRNRAVTDIIEPGSTVKPFTIAAALTAGHYTPETKVNTNPGWIKISGRTIRDHHNYGVIDVATVVQKSSNVAMTQIALSMQGEQLWQFFSALGFGQQAPLGFVGQSAGVFDHYSRWSKIKQASISYGYGFSTTLVHLAQAYSVIANNGVKKPITLVKQTASVKGERVMSAQVAEQVKAMLASVVTPTGTGFRAQVADYRVAGKTGTIRKPGKQGYTDDSYLALFAGMAPLKDPRLVLVVLVNDPKGDEYYGGQVAAPVYADVMEKSLRVLNVIPDNVNIPELQVARLDWE